MGGDGARLAAPSCHDAANPGRKKDWFGALGEALVLWFAIAGVYLSLIRDSWLYALVSFVFLFILARAWHKRS